MSPQVRAALTRAGIMVIVAAIAATNAYLLNEVDGRAAAAMFLAALPPILVRIGEGYYDQRRDEQSDIRPGDVGYRAGDS